MKQFSLYTQVILSLSVLVLSSLYQDIFTLRVIEAVVISVITTVLIDGLIIWRKEGKYRFPNSALITGLIIAALIEPELENRFIYLIAPALAILSKHLIRISGRNVFNPAAFGLLSLRLFYPEGFIVWWATTNIYLIIPLGLCIVLRMKGWHLVLSFMLATVPLYVIYGIHSHLNLVDSLNLINPFFVLFVLTEHKSAPVANKARIAYGCVVGVLSFLFHVFVPQVENSLTALLIGNVCAPIINRGFKTNGTH